MAASQDERRPVMTKKSLFIAEKPSVAQEFAKVLKVNGGRHDGYLETEKFVVTWCVGHLVTMSYPEAYDEKYKRWSFDTLPFLPCVTKNKKENYNGRKILPMLRYANGTD